MPKIKTNRAAAKRFKKDRYRKAERETSLQEPYLNQEVYKEKKKSQTGYHHRCNQCKEYEESITISVRLGKD